MTKLLPFSLLLAAVSVFGLLWIMTSVDPDTAHFSFFILFVFLLFNTVFNFFGFVLYFLRTRFRKRYSESWYFRTSYKMSFFVSVFVALSATLALLDMVTTLNILLAILIVALFAIWSFLGKTKESE